MNLLEEAGKDQLPESYKHLPEEEMIRRIQVVRQKFGEALFIPCHHYQKDEVIQFADSIGDSLQLAQAAAQNKKARYIIFCGVHFMAETADMLTGDAQKVLLPDLRAGCSMADMADIYQLEQAWPRLVERFGDTIMPITYINSTAAIKAFVGDHDGTTVTSSNAKQIVKHALTRKKRIFFLPDQHLGRNTAAELGIPLDEMATWNPIRQELEEVQTSDDRLQVILWKGYCSVHQHFTLKNIASIRKNHPAMQIIVHPECPYEVVQAADQSGSTKKIVDTIEITPTGSEWAIGTEANLVGRIIQAHPDKKIVSLNPFTCPCMTMNRIDLPHLLFTLEKLDQGDIINQIQVDKQTTASAWRALDRMLTQS